MSKYRQQVLLETWQKDELERISRETGKSLSEIVREMISEQLKQYQSQHLRQAAEEMAEEYRHSPDLTSLLPDGEDFIES
ncbi:MAG: ribbon-helix-helix protein, CopG family [Anaerolineaceae bacterium]|nr:ribbon-helix-helix protein, CopG family [Anaerolineaceae bacterium]